MILKKKSELKPLKRSCDCAFGLTIIFGKETGTSAGPILILPTQMIQTRRQLQIRYLRHCLSQHLRISVASTSLRRMAKASRVARSLRMTSVDGTRRFHLVKEAGNQS